MALGELVVWATNVSFPSSIIGMLFLTLFLHLKWIKLHWVKAISDLLLANLGLFFVPPSVAIMVYFDFIALNVWSIGLAVILSTILVIIITGYVYQLIRKKSK